MKRALVIVALCACGGGDAAKPAPKTPVVATPVAPAPAPAAGSGSAATQALTGSVKKIRVELAASSARASIESELAPLKGKPLDSDQMREALARVMKMPGVADVTVQGVQLADGIELVAQITLHPVMKKLTAIETPGGKAIALGMGAMPSNSPLEPARIQTLATGLRDRYVGMGHFAAEVSWKRTDVAGGVEVVIEVKPGLPSTIGSVTFQGNTLASKDLTAQVGKLLVAGQPMLEDKLEAAAMEISKYYWDKGYANVTVRAPKPAAGPNTVVFKIVEGPVFRIGPVKITGVPAAEHPKYLKLFGVKQGDVFSRTAIADGRQRVVDALVATGKPASDALPLTKVDLPAKTISLTLELSPR